MRTLFIAHALLLMSDPDIAGGIPAEPDPSTNDAGAAPAPEIATGGMPPGDPEGGGEIMTQDFTEADEAFRARLEAERAENERIRRDTPTQEVELRPQGGTSKLGVILGSPDGIRCIPLADWRTDRLCLQAGDHAQIVVLAGEGLKTWEFYRAQEARQKDPAEATSGDVTTRALTTAEAAGLLNAQAALNQQPAAAASPADPLENTQPVEKVVGGNPAGESGIGAGA